MVANVTQAGAKIMLSGTSKHVEVHGMDLLRTLHTECVHLSTTCTHGLSILN